MRRREFMLLVGGAAAWPLTARAQQPGPTAMRTRIYIGAGIALAALFASTLFVVSDDVPALNVNPVCRGIAAQSGNPTEKGGPDLKFKECVASEREVRDQLAKVWSTFSVADKGHCVRLANTGGHSSYTELITCLEMSRHVRQLRSTNSTKKTD